MDEDTPVPTPESTDERRSEAVEIGGIVGAFLASVVGVALWRIVLSLHNCEWLFGHGPSWGSGTFDSGDWKLALAGVATALPLVLFGFLTKHRSLLLPALVLAVAPIAYVVWMTNGQLSDPTFWTGRC